MTGAGLPERLTEFVAALRGRGISAGLSETVDAAMALEVLGLADRERVRAGLAAALVRAGGQRAVFDAVFDLYFPLGVGEPQHARAEPADLERLRENLVVALAGDDQSALTRLAGQAVAAFGRVAPSAGGGYSAYQTLDAVAPQTLLVRVLRRVRGAEPEFTDRLDRDEIRGRIESFRRRVRTESNRRTAELRGRERLVTHAVPPSWDQVDFLLADRDQLAELRRALAPLARRLATRLAARRRRHRRGEVDIRATLRRSLSTGGVPIRPATRRRRPGRPDLVLICDVSGSVAGFAHFTMLLVQALREQFSRVRVFAFVDTMVEVTHLVTAGEIDPAGLGARIIAEVARSGSTGRSDYGRALTDFADRHTGAVGPRTSVLILGDARTNGTDPNLPALRRVLTSARHAYWLNPERRTVWSTGDSMAHRYAEVVAMHECRTARQLGTLASRLLPA